jgi:acetaldehyde dehydrogenase
VTTASHYPVAVIGSGELAAELTTRIRRGSSPLRLAAVAHGIDDVKLVLDATTAAAHVANRDRLHSTGARIIDLTGAALGPHCVPAVNLDHHLDAPTLAMGTAQGQAAVPIVAAVARCGSVAYAEVVSATSTRTMEPDARAAVDDVIETTSAALQSVGGAQRGKTVLLLSPADPPTIARHTVYCLVDGGGDHVAIEQAIIAMVDRVTGYAPGYRLKQRVQFETFGADRPLHTPETGPFTGTRVTALLEVAATADQLAEDAGNLDITASAALAAAERIAAHDTAGAHRS